MSEKLAVLKEINKLASGEVHAYVTLFYKKEDAFTEMRKKISQYESQKKAWIDVDANHHVILLDNNGNKYIFLVEDNKPILINNNSVAIMTNLSEEDILRSYHSLEDLCQALDSCFDLFDLGYSDEITQENYIKLSELSALELWARWKTAHGRELY